MIIFFLNNEHFAEALALFRVVRTVIMYRSIPPLSILVVFHNYFLQIKTAFNWLVQLKLVRNFLVEEILVNVILHWWLVVHVRGQVIHIFVTLLFLCLFFGDFFDCIYHFKVNVLIVAFFDLNGLVVIYRAVKVTAGGGVVNALLSLIFRLFYHFLLLFLALFFSLVFGVFLLGGYLLLLRRNLVLQVDCWENLYVLISFHFESFFRLHGNLSRFLLFLAMIVVLDVHIARLGLVLVIAQLSNASQIIKVELVVLVHLWPIARNLNCTVTLHARTFTQEAAKTLFASLTLTIVNTEGLTTTKLDKLKGLVIVVVSIVIASDSSELVTQLVQVNNMPLNSFVARSHGQIGWLVTALAWQRWAHSTNSSLLI